MSGKHLSLSNDVTNSFVTLPNHHRVAVHSVGLVTLNEFLVLSNVLYIPSFHVNLISISALLHSLLVSVIFHTNSFSIQDRSTLRVIGRGNLIGGLYVFNIDTSPAQAAIPDINSTKSSLNNSTLYNSSHVANKFSVLSYVNTIYASTWHARLGHLSNKFFRNLVIPCIFLAPIILCILLVIFVLWQNYIGCHSYATITC